MYKSVLLPSALYLLELVNACNIPEKIVKHFTCIHSIFSGGVASQGEVHSRGNDFHECLWLTWWVPLSTRGRVYDSSSFCMFFLPMGESSRGWVVCDFEILPCDKGELSVHSCGWVFAYCEGMLFGLSVSELVFGSKLLHRLCRAFASFWRSWCFASAWLCRALPLSWGVMLCFV